MLESDLHTAGVSAPGDNVGHALPRDRGREQTLIPWPLLPGHTLPWAFPLGFPTSATLAGVFEVYDWLSLRSQSPGHL